MKKRILFTLAIFSLFASSIMAQAIEGGAGIVFIEDGDDPNTIAALEDVTVNEANIAYDRTNQIMWVFDPAGTAGLDQWIAIDVTSTVTSVVGANDISVTNAGGVYTVDFTEATSTLTWNSGTSTITYTDEDSNVTSVDLSDYLTSVNSSNTINVTGAGTVASPYVLELDGADTANSGEVPISDGSGAITWGQVIESAAFTADGELELTLSDGVTKVFVDMSSIPSATDDAALGILAGAVDATSGGVAKAAVNNTFGLPATANYSVLFIINQ